MPCAYHSKSRGFIATPKCQFNEPEHTLINVDGKQWCQFHLPLDAKDTSVGSKREWSDEQLKTFYARLLNEQHKIVAATNFVNFSGVQFPGYFPDEIFKTHGLEKFRILFCECIFDDGFALENLQFQNKVWFNNSVFREDVHILGTTFERMCDFSQIECHFDFSILNGEIKQLVRLDNARFAGDFYVETKTALVANSAVFSGNFKLEGSLNNDASIFTGCKFEDYAIFSGVNFGPVSFRQAEFYDEAVFSNTVFHDAANFSGTIFHQAPDFHGSRIHEGSTFRGAEFKDYEGSSSPQAYRTLKAQMENRRAWDDMAIFYALELRSTRHQPETKWPVRLMSLAYEHASDYGQSFLRPLVWLMITAFVFFVAYWLIHEAWGNGQYSWELVRNLWAFDLKQMVKPFDAIIIGVPIADLSPVGKVWMGFVATLQTLTTAGLVTVFILAVRRRFRMA